MTLSLSISIILSTSFQLINLIPVCSLVVRKLKVWFLTRYNKQRISILKALLLIIASLVILMTRYIVQSLILMKIYRRDEINLSDFNRALMITMVCVSNTVPIMLMIMCLEVELKGSWDCLLCNILRAPNQGDNSTLVGSHILEDLKGSRANFDEKLLASIVFDNQNKNINQTVTKDSRSFFTQNSADDEHRTSSLVSEADFNESCRPKSLPNSQRLANLYSL